MMKTAIILHGMPTKEEYFNSESESQSNKHWLPWIQRQLILNGVLAQTLELPEPYEPDYEKWSSVFEQFFVNENTIIVGHSCGGGFLVRWLSENKIKTGRVALVAPWINSASSRLKPGFFDFQIDETMAERTDGVCLFISSDDEKEMQDTAESLKENIKNLRVQEFSDKGHFTYGDMQTKLFPELKEFLCP